MRNSRGALRSGIIVATFLPALRLVLTDDEYIRIEDKKEDRIDSVNELVRILLTKDESTFNALCSALEDGYPHWASKLSGSCKRLLCHLSPIHDHTSLLILFLASNSNTGDQCQFLRTNVKPDNSALCCVSVCSRSVISVYERRSSQ